MPLALNILFLVLFLCTVALNAFTQTGIPYLKNYSHKDYTAEFEAGPQNWAIAQDNRGIMYFGNNLGILEYDGINWRLIHTSNESYIRSLSVDRNGTVYVGSQGEFGFLSPDLSGSMQFNSLSANLKSEDQLFEDVWQTHATENGIYFQTSNKVFRWVGNTYKVWKPQTFFHVLFNVNGEIYIRQTGVGLFKLIQDSLQLIANGESFANKRIYTMLPYNDDRILIGTREENFMLLSPAAPDVASTIQKFPVETDNILQELLIYNGVKLNENIYGIGTTRGGAIIIDNKGKSIGNLNKTTGLQDESVWNLFIDREKGLWLALNNGITRVEINSPISIFNSTNGLEGNVESITKYNNKLYIATHSGVYCLNQENNNYYFQKIPGISEQCWHLLPVNVNEKKLLLVANNYGVYQIEDTYPLKVSLIKTGIANVLYQSKHDTNRVFIGLMDSLTSIYMKKESWIDEGIVNEFRNEASTIIEDDKQNLWVGNTQGKWLYRISFPGKHDLSKAIITLFDTTHGLPQGWAYLNKAMDKIIIATSKGIYKPTENKEGNFRFVPDTTLGMQFADGSRGIHRLYEDLSGKIWMFVTLDKGFELGYVNIKEPSPAWNTTPFLRIPKQFVQTFFTEENGTTWIGGNDGLIRYDPDIAYNYHVNYSTLIRKVILKNDSVIFNGTYWKGNNNTSSHDNCFISLVQNKELKPILPFHLNSLSFQFTAPTFNNEKANQFQYYLEGYDNEWTKWAKESHANYTNLHEGQYKFHVRAKNIYGNVSQPAIYEFIVLPPWYRTIWAFGLYIISFILLTYSIVILRIQRLKREKEKLEHIVIERTAEVVKQKEEIEQKNNNLNNAYKEIEEKNKDITDSIRYAKKIQEAILLSPVEIRKNLPGSFVLFKPRDIVSGDFYWFTNVPNRSNEILLAVCDCTGHGVPGAFMSMIGNDLLNKIILEQEVIQPAEILNLLHLGVRFALQQHKEGANVKDGMDIALCHIDLKNKSLEYAGANRSMIIVKKDSVPPYELNEIKPDKFSIGGYQKEETRTFTNNKVSLDHEDTIYIFSDGFIDQFGGPQNRKYSTRKFKEFLQNIHGLEMEDQYLSMEKEIDQWKGLYEQTDDILVIGVRL